MKTKIYIALLILASCLTTSCNEWLDVKSDLDVKEKDLFDKEEGFKSALMGCYSAMESRDVYGEKLTMTDIENLACLWETSENADYKQSYFFDRHEYNNDDAKAAVKAIYGGLFNAITQANIVIRNIEANGQVIADPKVRGTIEGEAYAIRAYCQFDVLRLFGQVPQNATKQISLPYSNTTELKELPPYYSFSEYVTKLKADLKKAESLLKESDVACEYTLEGKINATYDEFLLNRQFRLNYYAVKALQARLALYLGEKEDAYAAAKAIIDEQYEGEKKFNLSGTSDLSTSYNYYACPSEALFMLSKYNLKDYTLSLLVGIPAEDARTYQITRNYIIPLTRFNELYEGVVTASENRYRSVWSRNISDIFGAPYCAIRKYYYKDDDNSLMTKHKVIPMIRLSEVYLIAMETAPQLSIANQLYKEYMRSHDVLVDEDKFTSEANLQALLEAEYRREFFAEGQMFYRYKRTNATTIKWCATPVNEDVYELPLPSTEYNPNK